MKWYNESGFVYIIQYSNEDVYKIGITRNSPQSRMSELQTACPYKLKLVKYLPVLDSKEWERILHSIYAPYRLEGEWFKLNDMQLREVIWYLQREAVIYEKRLILMHARGVCDMTGMPRCAHLLSPDEITDTLLTPTMNAINESLEHNQLDKTRDNTITDESFTNVTA